MSYPSICSLEWGVLKELKNKEVKLSIGVQLYREGNLSADGWKVATVILS